jgi:hypothetical protein
MKGQSSVAVRREAGVSYVKETESRQIGVSDFYERLGHTIFQGSYNLKIADDISISGSIFKRLFAASHEGSDLLFVCFESATDSIMKEFLLHPKKRLQLVPKVYFA